MKQHGPFVINVTRGDLVESRHHVRAVIVDSAGRAQHAWGNVDDLIYPRSSIKPLQALPLIETGAAEALQINDAEVALACSSHSGEAVHVEAVGDWLDRVGLRPEDLECGNHLPYDADAANQMVRDGVRDTNLHSNCSGKHTGFLTTAVHLGETPAGYIEPDHPVQQRVTGTLSEIMETDLASAPLGVDGCGIPVLGMPLRAFGFGLARLADPVTLAAPRAAAARRIVEAMMRHPYNVAGRGRFDTLAMNAGKGRFATKGGAEAVHGAIIPELKLGIALKAEDGAKRASDVAMGWLLDFLGLLDDAARAEMAQCLEAPVLNVAGRRVGTVAPADGWRD